MTATRRVHVRRLNLLFVFLLLATSACSGDDDTAKPSSSTTSTTATTPPAETPTSIGLPPARVAPVPNQGDPPADGSHAAYLRSLDIEAGTVTIDIIQWLDREAADAAYAQETGDNSGAPNDYYIVNATEALRTLALGSVEVTVAWDATGPRQRSLSLQELPGYLADRQDPDAPFWVTVAGGNVVRIDEQYRP